MIAVCCRAVVVSLLLLTCVWADQRASPYAWEGGGRVHVVDADIEAAAEIVDADTGFTPLQANSVIRVLYLGTANTDTALVHIVGLRSDTTRVDTLIRAAARNVASTAATFMAFEQAYLDTEEAAATIVYSGSSSSANRLRDIAGGTLHDPIAQVYAGKGQRELVDVRFAHENLTDTTVWELRLYPDIADHRDVSDGYHVIASARLFRGVPAETIPLGIMMPPASWAVVYSTAATAAVSVVRGSATLRWRDRR